MLQHSKNGIKFENQNKKKTNLHYTRGITLKRVTSGGIHLRDLTCGQHSSEEMFFEEIASY